MFLKKVSIKTKDKTYEYYSIAQSYREGGKVKTRTIQKLGAIPEREAQMYQAMLSGDLSHYGTLDQVCVEDEWLYLPVVLLHSVWSRLELSDVLKHPFWVEAMVLNRIIKPKTKIRVLGWASKTALPAICGASSANPFGVYRKLDILSEMDTPLQLHICKAMAQFDSTMQSGSIYDITSTYTYLKSSTCFLAKYGYSRDHRPDLKQIALALVVTPAGTPYYWKIMPGNTPDITTLTEVVRELKRDLMLEGIFLVFDRGMGTPEHFRFLMDNGVQFLTATDKSEFKNHGFFTKTMKKAIDPDRIEEDPQDLGFLPTDEISRFYSIETMEPLEGSDGWIRFACAFDPGRFKTDGESLANRIKLFEKWLDDRNIDLANAKRSRSEKTLAADIEAMLKKRSLKGIMTVNVENAAKIGLTKKGGETKIATFKLSCAIDQEKFDDERKTHGITCYRTNTTWSPNRMVIKYRIEKNKVEESFRGMKSSDSISMRPIYLTTVPRIHAHITICIISLLIKNTMSLILKSHQIKQSVSEIISSAEKCRLTKLRYKDERPDRVLVVAGSEDFEDVIAALDCQSYFTNDYLHKMEDFLFKSAV